MEHHCAKWKVLCKFEGLLSGEKNWSELKRPFELCLCQVKNLYVRTLKWYRSDSWAQTFPVSDIFYFPPFLAEPKTMLCWQEKKCLTPAFLEYIDKWLESKNDFSCWQEHFILFRSCSTPCRVEEKNSFFCFSLKVRNHKMKIETE